MAECTRGASTCPVHGMCTCESAFDAVRQHCPLHGVFSEHPIDANGKPAYRALHYQRQRLFRALMGSKQNERTAQLYRRLVDVLDIYDEGENLRIVLLGDEDALAEYNRAPDAFTAVFLDDIPWTPEMTAGFQPRDDQWSQPPRVRMVECPICRQQFPRGSGLIERSRHACVYNDG